MARAGTLHDAFIDELRDAYDAGSSESRRCQSSPERRRRPISAQPSSPTRRKRADKSNAWGRYSPASMRRCAASIATALPGSSKREVRHGRGLRRLDHGCVPDRCRATGRALRDGGLRKRWWHAHGRWAIPRPPAFCNRRWMRKRPPTRSSPRTPKAASIRSSWRCASSRRG